MKSFPLLLCMGLALAITARPAGAKDTKLCNEVLSKAATHYQYSVMQNWISYTKGQSFQIQSNGGVKVWEKNLDEALSLQASLKPYCEDKAILKKLESCKDTLGQPRLQGLYHKKDPAVWCMAHANAQDAMVKDLEMLIEFSEKYNYKVLNQPTESELIRREGWLGQDRLVGWSAMFEVNEAYAKEALRKYMGMFKKIGKYPQKPEALFESRRDALKKGGEAALKAGQAGKWKLPKKGKSNYGVKLAKKRYIEAFPNAKVLKAAAKKGSWTIKKNRLGVPLYRDKFGYLLAQVPGEPLCQLRIWFISEKYNGRKYVKDDAVGWSNLRFQKCR